MVGGSGFLLLLAIAAPIPVRAGGCDAGKKDNVQMIMDDCHIFEEHLTIFLHKGFKQPACITKMTVVINSTRVTINNPGSQVTVKNTIRDKCQESTVMLVIEHRAREIIKKTLNPLKCFMDDKVKKLTFKEVPGEDRIHIEFTQAMKTAKMKTCLKSVRVSNSSHTSLPTSFLTDDSSDVAIDRNKTHHLSVEYKFQFGEEEVTRLKSVGVPRAEFLKFGPWTLTERCSEPCGSTGRRIEVRSCDAISGADCDPKLYMKVGEVPCANQKNCTGEYSDWTEWSTCDIDCVESTMSPGLKSRSRDCIADCETAEKRQVQKSPCWGNPDPTFCTTDCDILSARVRQTTKGRNYDIKFEVRKPEKETISKIVMLVNSTIGIETKFGFKSWRVSEAAVSSPWEAVQGYYDIIAMACEGCTRTSAWCNCTIGPILQEQNYSVSIKVEERLRTTGDGEAAATRVTHCPVTDTSADTFQCELPEFVDEVPKFNTSIPATQICDGVPAQWVKIGISIDQYTK